MKGFWSVAKKELTHLLRDRASLIMALFLPIFQVCMYGYAIDFDVRHISAVLVDHDKSRESREYVAKLHASQYVDVNFIRSSGEDALALLKSGKAKVAITIPPDFSRKMAAGTAPQVGVVVDGSDSQVSLRARTAFMSPGQGRTVDARVGVLFNPNSRTSTYMIPGLIGFILQIILTSLTSGSIVREREQGSLEQLMVTPISKLGLMLGKLAPFLILALFEMILILVFGWVLFDVSVSGSLILLFALSIPFVLASLGLGLLLSTVAQNQAQALQLSTFTFLPNVLLSGFLFPRETMPGILQLISNVLPLTHELEILRGIVVRGAGLSDLWPHAVWTTAVAALFMYLATSRFQKSVS